MNSVRNISSVESLIGKSVLSLASGNKLGQIVDALIDPARGAAVGLVLEKPDGSIGVTPFSHIASFGEDAIMAKNDASFVADDDPIALAPRAKKNLTGAQIITEGGKILGDVAAVYLHLKFPPLAIYEVRESVLDKLLGRALFIPAMLSLAVSDDAQRIIVPEDFEEDSAERIEEFTPQRINELFDEETLLRERGEAAGS